MASQLLAAWPGPFNKEQFLLRALAALFLAQLLLHLLTLASGLRAANQPVCRRNIEQTAGWAIPA